MNTIGKALLTLLVLAIGIVVISTAAAAGFTGGLIFGAGCGWIYGRRKASAATALAAAVVLVGIFSGSADAHQLAGACAQRASYAAPAVGCRYQAQRVPVIERHQVVTAPAYYYQAPAVGCRYQAQRVPVIERHQVVTAPRPWTCYVPTVGQE